jgi:hypothetical protein
MTVTSAHHSTSNWLHVAPAERGTFAALQIYSGKNHRMIRLIHKHCYSILTLLFSTLSVCHFSFAQHSPDTVARTVATPIMGWDSLSAFFSYPAIAERAGVIGAYVANVNVDTNGRVVDVTVKPFNNLEQRIDSTRDPWYWVISDRLRSVKFYPATTWGRPINSTVSIPIVFNTVTKSRTSVLNVEGFTSERSVSPWLTSPDGLSTANLATAYSDRFGNGQNELDKITIVAPGGAAFETRFMSQYQKKGYHPIHLAWTPNSRYLVYNVSRFEGEHPYHFPIYFYSIKTRSIYNFDERMGYVVSNFELISPDSVKTSCILKGDSIQTEVTVSLDQLISK